MASKAPDLKESNERITQATKWLTQRLHSFLKDETALSEASKKLPTVPLLEAWSKTEAADTARSMAEDEVALAATSLHHPTRADRHSAVSDFKELSLKVPAAVREDTHRQRVASVLLEMARRLNPTAVREAMEVILGEDEDSGDDPVAAQGEAGDDAGLAGDAGLGDEEGGAAAAGSGSLVLQGADSASLKKSKEISGAEFQTLSATSMSLAIIRVLHKKEPALFAAAAEGLVKLLLRAQLGSEASGQLLTELMATADSVLGDGLKEPPSEGTGAVEIASAKEEGLRWAPTEQQLHAAVLRLAASVSRGNLAETLQILTRLRHSKTTGVSMPGTAKMVMEKLCAPLRISSESTRAQALAEAGLLCTASGGGGGGSIKEYYFNRLNPSSDGNSQNSTWGMGPSSRDAVKLKVSKPVVVLGVGSYGGNHGTYKPLCELHTGSGSTSSSTKLTEGQSEYSGMTHQEVMRVHYKEAVYLKADEDYTFIQYMKNGSCSGFYGSSG